MVANSVDGVGSSEPDTLGASEIDQQQAPTGPARGERTFRESGYVTGDFELVRFIAREQDPHEPRWEGADRRQAGAIFPEENCRVVVINDGKVRLEMLLPQQRCRRQPNGLWNDDIGLWCRFVRARPQSFRRNTLNVCVKPDVPDRGSVGRITDWWQSQEDATAERVDHEVGLHLRYLRWHTDVRRCNLSAFVEFEGLEAESFGQLHIEAVAAGRYCIKQIENSISDIGCELAAVAQETFDRLVHVVEVTIRRPRGDPCQQLCRC